MNRLEVGLLVNSVHSDKYVSELALWAREQPDLNLSHLIVHRPPAPGLRLIAARAILQIIVSAEKILLGRCAPHKDHHALRDLSKSVDRIVEIQPVASRSDHECAFSDEDVERVKALKLDLLISCGSSVPRGAILEASRLGVISFLHVNGVDQPGPVGFWETYHRRPQTSFVIQRLGAERGTGEVLARGSFRTRFYYSANQANVHKKCVTYLKKLLKKAAATGELPAPQRIPRLYAPLRAPGLGQCLVYGCKLSSRIFFKALATIPLLRERFGVSVLRGKWNEPRFWRVAAASLRRPRYWADPFLYARDGRTFCFVEDVDSKTNRGHITVLEVLGTRLLERGIALQEPFHLSFPFLFSYQGELYMCPESCTAGQIRVYRCTQFPLQWRLEKTLMEGVSAVDAILFEKGGRWWMLANIDESETQDYCSELHLFSADSPLSTSWVAHPQNPLLVDSIGGRNGGMIVDGERLFRIGQCQGFDRYGQSLRVYEIKEVSESRYVEELVAEIKPDRRQGILGTHHLSTDGTTTVVDHASSSFASWASGARA